MERWPSWKAVMWVSEVKVVRKQWQEERWCQNQARPSIVDIMLRTKAWRWARAAAEAFSLARMDLRSVAESGISRPLLG